MAQPCLEHLLISLACQLRRLSFTEAGIKYAAAATDPSADAWELENDDDGAGRALRRVAVELWAREPCTANLVRRATQPTSDITGRVHDILTATVDLDLSHPFWDGGKWVDGKWVEGRSTPPGEPLWVLISDGAPSSVALLARAATGRGDELVFQPRSYVNGTHQEPMLSGSLLLAMPAGSEARNLGGVEAQASVVTAFELFDGFNLMRFKYRDRAPPNEPSCVCFSTCRRLEAVGVDGRRLGPIASLDDEVREMLIDAAYAAANVNEDGSVRPHVEVNGTKVAQFSLELLRQVSLPAGVCD